VPYEGEYRQHKLWRRTGRGGGIYYALWNDHRGKLQKRSLDTADTTTAKDRLVDFALRNGCFQAEPAHRLTVRELVQHHYATYARGLASGEQAYHHSRILIARLGHLRLDQLISNPAELFGGRGFGPPVEQGVVPDHVGLARQGEAVQLEGVAQRGEVREAAVGDRLVGEGP
jgi:hypothetical protein